MITTLNILMILLLFWIFFEDLKNRQISLLAIIGLLLVGGYLNMHGQMIELLLLGVLMNLLIVSMVVFVLWIYIKLKLKKQLFRVFGLGDLLFFVFLAIGFPTPTFLVFFSASLVFSLIISIVFKKQLTKWVPLAGLQALFVALVVGVNQLLNITNLYAI